MDAQTGFTAFAVLGNVNEIGITTSRPNSKADEETKLVSFLHAEITVVPPLVFDYLGLEPKFLTNP